MEAVVLLAGVVVSAGAGVVKWLAYLRYLERAASRGSVELQAAARAAATYPLRRPPTS